MAVPDNNNFTLKDVQIEISTRPDDLSQCFTDAIASAFDSAHEGSKDRLLNFRNYEEPGIVDGLIFDQEIDITEHVPVGFNRSGIFVSTDGTKVFILGNDRKVYKFTLSVAFNLYYYTYNGVSVDITTSWGVSDSAIRGIRFNSSGTKLYAMAIEGPEFDLFEHTLSTAWDIGTINVASPVKVNFTSMPTISRFSSLSFNDAGTQLSIMFSDNPFSSPYDEVYKTYTLSTPWSISTINNLASENTVTFTGNSGSTYYHVDMAIFDRSDSNQKKFCIIYYNRVDLKLYLRIYQTYSTTPAKEYLVQAVNQAELIDIPTTDYLFSVDANNIVRRYSFNAPLADVEPPTTPGQPSQTALCATTLSLSWTGSTDNVEVTGYNVYRNGVLFKDAGNNTSTNLTGVPEGTTNTWTIRAYDAENNLSSASAGRVITQGIDVTFFTVSASSSTSSGGACGLIVNSAFYHDGDGISPTIGDRVFEDPCGLNELDGLNRWRKTGSSTAIRINSFGSVTSLVFC